MTFSDTVVVTGTPRLVLRMDAYNVNADYNRGSNSTKLVFHYAVKADDTTPGSKSFSVDDNAVHASRGLQLNGGTIKSTTGVDATLSGTRLANLDDAHRVGLTVDRISISSSPANGDTYGIGEHIDFVMHMSSPPFVHNIGVSKLAFRLGDGSSSPTNNRQASYRDPNTPVQRPYRYTVVCQGRRETRPKGGTKYCHRGPWGEVVRGGWDSAWGGGYPSRRSPISRQESRRWSSKSCRIRSPGSVRPSKPSPPGIPSRSSPTRSTRRAGAFANG